MKYKILILFLVLVSTLVVISCHRDRYYDDRYYDDDYYYSYDRDSYPTYRPYYYYEPFAYYEGPYYDSYYNVEYYYDPYYDEYFYYDYYYDDYFYYEYRDSNETVRIYW